jgi:sugar phosphate isomerase/epimerase
MTTEELMRIGFCAGLAEDDLKFAREAGFDGVEMFVPNKSMMDPAKITASDIKAASECFDRSGVKALTVFHYQDYADPDPARAKAAEAGLKKTMDVAEGLGTKVVTCNAWVPGGVPFAEQLAFYRKTFGKFAKWFEDRGMQLAIENCPHGGKNIAYSPWAWTQIFDAVPSKAIGLEFDPSHLLWQFIDYPRAMYEFADRIYAFHAKDTQINAGVLDRTGTAGPGWWKFRIPGYGDVDWKVVFRILTEIGFSGDMIIEHEDPVFKAERRHEGLKLGLKELKSHMV